MKNKIYQLPDELVVSEDENGSITVMNMSTLAIFRFDGMTAQLFQRISNKEPLTKTLDWLVEQVPVKNNSVLKTLKKEAAEELKRYLKYLKSVALITEAG